MLVQLKKLAPTYIPLAVTIAGIFAQAGSQYMTSHPKVTLGGFFGALGLAVVNHWIKSPRTA